jgi:hypothetical protein
VLGALFGFVFYKNTSSRAQLYEGAPYHSTTFRVTSVQFARITSLSGTKGTHTETRASASGLVEGHKESMDLLPYLNRIPRDEHELRERVPEGTVIPVYLFPTLMWQDRIQLIHGVPTEEWYSGLAAWVSNRVFPVVGAIGILTALLSLARFYLSRNHTVAN